MLKEHYIISQYWRGQRYLDLDLDWDYQNHVVQLSMLKYVANAITFFHHKHPQKPQDRPYPHINTSYGTKAQYSPDVDNSPLLTSADKTFVQEVTGTFRYYARSANVEMLKSLGSIANKEDNPTKNTIKKFTQFLDYYVSHPDAIITYNVSNMALAGHSDASYILGTKA